MTPAGLPNQALWPHGREPTSIAFLTAPGMLRLNSGVTNSTASTALTAFLNVVQAAEAGAHIITVPPDMLKKLALFGRDLGDYSLETVRMFHDDARAAGYSL